MSSAPKSNLAVRLSTVVIAGPVLLAILFLAPPLAWALLIVAAAGVAAHEMLGMTHPGDGVSQALGVLSAMALATAIYVGGDDPRVLMTTIVAAPILTALVPLIRLGQVSTAALRMMAGIATTFYVGVLLITLALLRREQGDEGPAFVFLTLTIAWMGDTGGYTFGRLFGKTPLYPAVSPKKTREGFVGSLVFAVGAALVASFTYLRELPALDAVFLGMAGGALGQLGDLAESLLKRSTGIKDSGSILPGHGGLLDRIDALMVVGPLVYLYTLWF